MENNGCMTKKNRWLSQEALELIASMFRVLSEPMRLRILQSLNEKEKTVTQIVKATGAGQANISKHLSILFAAGLVARRRVGLNTYYRIADVGVFDLCELVCISMGQRLSAQRDSFQRLREKG